MLDFLLENLESVVILVAAFILRLCGKGDAAAKLLKKRKKRKKKLLKRDEKMATKLTKDVAELESLKDV